MILDMLKTVGMTLLFWVLGVCSSFIAMSFRNSIRESFGMEPYYSKPYYIFIMVLYTLAAIIFIIVSVLKD